MAATSVSAAKNLMARAVESILDPWPGSMDPVWDFFGSECVYCGVKLVKGARLGHIDHATSKAGNHMGNLVLACSVCNGDEKRDMHWLEFLEHKVSDPGLRRERIERIERWQALHPKPGLAASAEVAAVDAELRAMIIAFGAKCAELRAAVADAKSAAASSDG
ncbi:MAG: HNH endonuclease [Solirubrobacteraceae bacterium]